MSNATNSPVSQPNFAFASLNLRPELLDTLTHLEYQQMTAVQQQALPHLLAGRDCIVQARTGSGKTAAFALSLLQQLDVQRFRVQTLVLCPTRELADQVAEEIRTLARGIHNIKVLTLCGGVPQRAQIISLEHGAHILVGTPGRVLDHLQQQRIDFSHLSCFVLDEADRMLEMGFQTELQAITKALPKQRQTLLFSATYPPQIAALAGDLLHNPEHIKVQETDTIAAAPAITQIYYELGSAQRDEAVKRILQQHQSERCVVFCNTKRSTHAMASSLIAQGYSAIALHGDLEQKDRDQALVQFNHGSARILVATDVAARGLDIAELDLVINAELAHDADTHTHRIGRTGRAGASGVAATIVGANESAPEKLHSLPPASLLTQPPLTASSVTIQIMGGKKHKLRPGDIVGALTKDNQVPFEQIGKIKVLAGWSYVAVNTTAQRTALHILNNSRLKGRSYRAFVLR